MKTTLARVIATAAVLIVLLAAGLRADEAEDKAVQAIKKLGGDVTRDNKAEGKPVIVVLLFNATVTDGDLKELKAFKGLKELILGNTAVTDAGLKELKELKDLQLLDIGGTKVTDAGLKELKDLKKLKSLYLRESATDTGLKELK